LDSEELYKEVVTLHAQGFGSRRIAKMLGVPERRKSIEQWIYPLRKGKTSKPRTNPDLTPSPELSYLVGARLGDGTVYKNRRWRKYAITLRAKDRDFVEYFRDCLTKVSRRKVSFFYNENMRMWIASVSSKPLYLFLRSKNVYDYAVVEPFPSGFIRGLADAEGSVCISKRYKYVRVEISNTDKALLEYTKSLLLKYFGISSQICGKGKTRGNKVAYKLLISKQLDVAKFARMIGFAIRRKMEKLSQVLNNANRMLERLKLYDQALLLHKQGMGYKQISKKLAIPRGTIEGWISRGHKPIHVAVKVKPPRVKRFRAV